MHILVLIMLIAAFIIGFFGFLMWTKNAHSNIPIITSVIVIIILVIVLIIIQVDPKLREVVTKGH